MTNVVEPNMLAIDRASIREATVPGAATKNALALILAGGRGSRLEQLTDWRAKPAVPFGGEIRVIDFAPFDCGNPGIRRLGGGTPGKGPGPVPPPPTRRGFFRRPVRGVRR